MTNRGACRVFVAAFAVVWAGALALWLIGTFGWFGQARDPLSGIFLLPLGLPWNLLLGGTDGWTSAITAASAPLLNLAMLVLICRAFR